MQLWTSKQLMDKELRTHGIECGIRSTLRHANAAPCCSVCTMVVQYLPFNSCQLLEVSADKPAQHSVEPDMLSACRSALSSRQHTGVNFNLLSAIRLVPNPSNTSWSETMQRPYSPALVGYTCICFWCAQPFAQAAYTSSCSWDKPARDVASKITLLSRRLS